MIKHIVTAIAAAAMLTFTPAHSIAQTLPVAEITLLWDQAPGAIADVTILQRKIADAAYAEIARIPFLASSTSSYKSTSTDFNKAHCFTAYNMKNINGTEVLSKPSNEVCMTLVYVEGVVNFRGVLNLK